MSYAPIQPGIAKDQAVSYREFSSKNELVYCLWELHPKQQLTADFEYLVLPDGCIDLVFDLSKKPSFEGSLLMTPAKEAMHLNLGRDFSFVGIRFQPGTWLHVPRGIVGQMMRTDVIARIDLNDVRQRLLACNSKERLVLLDALVLQLQLGGAVGANPFVGALLRQEFSSVEELVRTSGYSRRQAQRKLQEQLGFAPHDFIKVMRFQQALANKDSNGFSDQSHYIREFKRVTGMTPRAFTSKYGRSMQSMTEFFAYNKTSNNKGAL